MGKGPQVGHDDEKKDEGMQEEPSGRKAEGIPEGILGRGDGHDG